MARKLVAETYPESSKERTDWFTKAETQFNEVSSKASRTSEPGTYFLSVLYRGQTQAALAKNAEAIDSLSRVADQQEGGVFSIDACASYSGRSFDCYRVHPKQNLRWPSSVVKSC